MRKGVLMSEENISADKPKRTRATKKVADTLPVSKVVVEQHVINEEGQKVISAPKKAPAKTRSNVHTKDGGAIGSHAADNALAKKEIEVDSKEKDKSKVAIWSEKNIRWGELGHISKGYNIVTKEAADKWLSRSGIRKATPEEVASYYGKNVNGNN